MSERLDIDHRKLLHSGAYVENDKRKSPKRLLRLLDRMLLQKSYDVADFGCGNAIMLEYIKDKVSHYYGVDFSEDFITLANDKKSGLRATNASFYCDSITNFCGKFPNSFDAGFAFDLSEHIYDDEWQEIINAMFRSLRPGGHLYLHTPNAEFILEILKERGILLRQFPEHIAVRNASQNTHFLEKAGFTDISVLYLSHYNIVRIVHPLSYLPVIGKYFQARLFIEAIKPRLA